MTRSAQALLGALAVIAASELALAQNATGTTSGILAVASPTWLPSFPLPAGVATSYPTGPIDTSATLSRTTLNLSAYPDPWTSPPTTSEEVQNVIKAIDWTKVPAAPTHKAKSNGDLDMSGYSADDPYCWWSDTNCVKPKVDYLPEDIWYCPNAGDWGLNYDDGPYNPTGDNATDAYAEPELYNFLAKHNNQKATLFYIGSNVITYPAAAQRALNDGHVLCVHTWSHPQMTSQTNEQVVAELYWALRAIKEATGVTSRCWRPPYGDVDDRVRAIAWQMGMRTIIWDEDTDDWNLQGADGGTLAPATVDGYFENWIGSRKNGTDTAHGHIVLEHELNNMTVSMAEKWLPQLQETFNVVTIHQCMNISQPYWETSWVYPTEANPSVPAVSNTTSSNATASGANVTPSASNVLNAKVNDEGKATLAGSASGLFTVASLVISLVFYHF